MALRSLWWCYCIDLSYRAQTSSDSAFNTVHTYCPFKDSAIKPIPDLAGWGEQNGTSSSPHIQALLLIYFPLKGQLTHSLSILNRGGIGREFVIQLESSVCRDTCFHVDVLHSWICATVLKSRAVFEWFKLTFI